MCSELNQWLVRSHSDSLTSITADLLPAHWTCWMFANMWLFVSLREFVLRDSVQWLWLINWSHQLRSGLYNIKHAKRSEDYCVYLLITLSLNEVNHTQLYFPQSSACQGSGVSLGSVQLQYVVWTVACRDLIVTAVRDCGRLNGLIL